MNKAVDTKRQGFRPDINIKSVRMIARLLIKILGVNGRSRWGNEFIQAIDKGTTFKNPLDEYSQLKAIAGHGRLYWRYKDTPKLEWETNDWINTFTKGKTFYDIGSNVGVYSLMAVQTKSNNVVSFEIDPLNASIQHQNIYSNNMQESILLLPIGLSDYTSVRDIHFKTISEGDALHSIDEISPSVAEENREKTIKGQIATFKLDELISIMGLPAPSYVKIDVDGAELKILKGMESCLSTVESAMVEVDNGSFSDVWDFLRSLGFELVQEYPVHGNSEGSRNILFRNLSCQPKTGDMK